LVSTSYDLNPCSPLQQPTNTKLFEESIPATDTNALHPDNQGNLHYPVNSQGNPENYGNLHNFVNPDNRYNPCNHYNSFNPDNVDNPESPDNPFIP
jgi:hypothetical protein